MAHRSMYSMRCMFCCLRVLGFFHTCTSLTRALLLDITCMLASCLCIISKDLRVWHWLPNLLDACTLGYLAFALHLCQCVFVTRTYWVCFFCRYQQVTKRKTSGHKQIYDVIVLPQQQPAVVKFARHPYPEEVHVECANRHLAPELLGVYRMPGGFNQVQSLARNINAYSISDRLQRWGKRRLV